MKKILNHTWLDLDECVFTSREKIRLVSIRWVSKDRVDCGKAGFTERRPLLGDDLGSIDDIIGVGTY